MNSENTAEYTDLMGASRPNPSKGKPREFKGGNMGMAAALGSQTTRDQQPLRATPQSLNERPLL